MSNLWGMVGLSFSFPLSELGVSFFLVTLRASTLSLRCSTGAAPSTLLLQAVKDEAGFSAGLCIFFRFCYSVLLTSDVEADPLDGVQAGARGGYCLFRRRSVLTSILFFWSSFSPLTRFSTSRVLILRGAGHAAGEKSASLSSALGTSPLSFLERTSFL